MNFNDVTLVRVNFLHLGIFPEVGDPVLQVPAKHRSCGVAMP